MKSDFFKNFTNQYKLSKTLRFELRPIGKTLENIHTKRLLEKDEKRASSYKRVKKIIDEYHKYYIELALKDVQLSKLKEYYELYSQNKELRSEEAFKNIKTELRKEIVKQLTKGPYKVMFERLFSKELIREDLKLWIQERPEFHDELEFIKEFDHFTTYFTGFNENRANMYSDEEQSTAIAYRIIHENLPKFIDNIQLYESIKIKYPDLELTPVLNEMEDIIQGSTLDEIFSIAFFNNVLSQHGIELINFIIGGRTLENGDKIKGLNEYINLYNQQQKEKNRRAPKFKQLYKQILSDRNSISLRFEAFENDSELLDTIEVFYQTQLCGFESEGKIRNILDEIKIIVTSVAAYDLEKIYIRNDTNLTNISQRIFGFHGVFKDAISYYYDSYIDPLFQSKIANARNENALKKHHDLKEKWNKEYISISVLQTALTKYMESIDDLLDIKKAYTPNVVGDYFVKHFNIIDEEKKETDLVYNIRSQYLGVKGMLNIEKSDNKKLAQDKERVHQLKSFLDSVLELNHFVKPLYVKADILLEKDELFYGQYTPLYEQLNKLIPLYNMVRNYLTQKPYSTEKIKLNFENSTLLGGWDVNKEVDNSSVILRKDRIYYLGIMDKDNRRIFLDIPPNGNESPFYEKMNYKLLPGPNKMLPKVFFARSRIDYFNPSQEILENYKNETHKKGDTFKIADCRKLIDFFKASIEKHEDWKKFNFKFSPTYTYADLSGFYRDVEHQGYKISFENISCDYIDKMVDEGKLYLFQIYNKDFSVFSKGKPNLHTLYWKALFDERNLENVVYKLNGEAEIFFRKSSIEEKNIVIHKANTSLLSKNLLSKDNLNIFQYDIIKDRRYTVDKFQLHVPIALNFRATGSELINLQTNEFLKNNPDIKIIGLDRGERNLIYLALIDQKGNILLQESLNTIKNRVRDAEINTPYQLILSNKENERKEARKSWGTIENIKDLKEGYISQVVNKIATMMVEHNAIVIMEDLNFGFKRGRFKVEKQVYQKLEKMLIDKLNYLVFKDQEIQQPGGLLNALQLTSKFGSFQKMGKQSGFLFYVPAWNTSKIDPVTGFVDFLKPKYENLEQSKSFFANFENIRYNPSEDYFEFSFDYKNFTEKANGTRTKWTVCTVGNERYYYNPSDKTTLKIDITKEMKELFDKENINYNSGENIKQVIINSQSKYFYIMLCKYLGITLALRYSNEGRDFILSPVANEKGKFYHSETADKSLPHDADANGAYHIALKGLWVLQQLASQEDLKKPKLAIGNKEWLSFVQNKDY